MNYMDDDDIRANDYKQVEHFSSNANNFIYSAICCVCCLIVVCIILYFVFGGKKKTSRSQLEMDARTNIVGDYQSPPSFKDT